MRAKALVSRVVVMLSASQGGARGGRSTPSICVVLTVEDLPGVGITVTALELPRGYRVLGAVAAPTRARVCVTVDLRGDSEGEAHPFVESPRDEVTVCVPVGIVVRVEGVGAVPARTPGTRGQGSVEVLRGASAHDSTSGTNAR